MAQFGVLVTAEPVHQVSATPPSQAPAVTPVVLQTRRSTLSPLSASETPMAVDQVSVEPGFNWQHW